MQRWIAGGVAFLATAAAFFWLAFFKRYNVPTGSMAPTIEQGDQVIIGRFANDVMRGDLIAFRHPTSPNTNLVKRVVGLPCDTIELRDKVLFVNGVPAAEPYTQFFDVPVSPRDFLPLTVPAGEYFVLGDNRDNSNDSRYIGCIPASLVRGRVLFILGRHHMGRPHRPPVLASLPSCRSNTSAPLAKPATTPAR